MPHAILTLVRHAETTGNLNRLLQGVTDSPLTVFGQAQVDALARAWATTWSNGDQSRDSTSSLDLPPPMLVVCSPIGRARKTAEAVHAACSRASQPSAHIVEDRLNQPGTSRLEVMQEQLTRDWLALIVDPGLAEKDFGWKESTRGGTHVAGYPKGQGSGESRTDFAQRVRRVGAEWLEAACSLASAHSTSTTSEAPIPHIVLVSHGMWISTFLSAHPPTTISHTSAQPGFLPFAANTGMFSLKVQLPPGPATARPTTDLFRANDVRHLANVKRQKGGIGRGAFDSKQTKLSSFFARTPSQNLDAGSSLETSPSPTKKRKT
jgi:broad specificity phosphatase PhoE